MELVDGIKVIGVSGQAGSGKDYIASHILRPLGYLPFSFAWHFKVFLVANQQGTYEEIFHTKPPHIRDLLQKTGTELGRNVYGEFIWVDTVSVWLRLMQEQWGFDKWVIPDIRFFSEVDGVRRLGGKIMRVEAPERVRGNRMPDELRAHKSETELDGYNEFDWFIDNDPNPITPVDEQVNQFLKLFGYV
jgi:dephospho-CoA kinase